MTAFAAHFLKEVSRSQLQSAARTLLPDRERKRLQTLEKGELIIPLAKAFLKNNIIHVKTGADMTSLSRSDVQKIGPF